jgi:rubrerythrin
LLEGKGFKEVYNLNGGIKAWQGVTAFGPVEMGMVYLKGDETPAEIVVLAYGMEEGLAAFYSKITGLTEDPEVVGILKKLAGAEENHKTRLFRVYLDLDPAIKNKEEFETRIVSDVMESGFTMEEFLERNRPSLQTIENVLGMAMMLETQALDLYMRYSHRATEEKSKSVLYDIAEEEKAHLSILGRLLESRA